jgi:hypothetical protein
MVGGSAQEMQGYLSYLTKESANLANGLGSSLIPILGKMGVAMIDSKGKARSALDELQDIAKWAQGKNREQVFAWFQEAGMPAGVANLLLENPEKFSSILGQAKKFTPTNEEAASAAQMTMQIALLRAQFLKLGYDLLEKVTPVLEKLFALLEGGLNWCLSHQTAVLSFFAALAAAIGVVTVATTALFISTIEISGPILLVVAAVAALTAAFVALASDYQDWSKGTVSTFDWTQFEKNIQMAAHAFEWLGEKISEVTNLFENLLRKFGINIPEGSVKRLWWNNFTIPGLLGIKMKGGSENSLDSSGNLSPETITSYFQSKGYSKEWAAAMAASAMAESSGNPKAIGDNGTSFGLFQLHDQARKDAFRAMYGHDISQSNADEQLDFAYSEMKRFGVDTSSSVGARYAAAMITQRFERPSDMVGESMRRGNYAESIMRGVPGATDTSSAASSYAGSGSTTTDNSRVTHIGKIDIHTQATDAHGIWKDMQRGMDWLTMSPANSGSL